MLVAAIQFRASGVHGDLLFLGVWIAAYGRAAILARGGHGIFEGNFRLRSGNVPSPGLQVHLAGTDVHADLRRAILLDDIFLDGHERVALHRVGRTVGERDAGHAFGGRLNQIALVQRDLIVGIHPLHGIDLLDLHLAVEVDETRLPRRGM